VLINKSRRFPDSGDIGGCRLTQREDTEAAAPTVGGLPDITSPTGTYITCSHPVSLPILQEE